MANLLSFQATAASYVLLVLLLIKIFAFVDALLRRPDAFEAAGKLTKPAWLLILGLAVLCDAFLSSTLLIIAGIVAAFVYLLDARPAIKSVTPPRR